MLKIDHFDLRTFDLNLLIAFDALMRERSVTRAAELLKIRQPAMSHSLSLLRTLFHDELFVRVGTVMQPTVRALALAEPVEQALGMMQKLIHVSSQFDPSTDQRIFRMGFSSEVELLLMPELVLRMRQMAPGVKLHGRPVGQREVYRMLDDRVLDLAIGCFDSQAMRYRQHLLFEQSLSCVFHPDKMMLKSSISLEDYLSVPQVLVSLSDSLHGCLESALGAIGRKLNVVATSSEFLSVLGMIASAPLIATLPTRMARHYGKAFGLHTVPVPITLTLPAVSLVWTAQEDNNPASQWLRGEIGGILGGKDNGCPAPERSV